MNEEWPNWPAPPERIKVAHRYYRVEPLDILSQAQTGADGTANVGSQVIRLRPDVYPAYAVEVLLHEIGHVIWRTGGLAPGSMKGTPADLEENIVMLMSLGMAGVLVDNPDLLQWIDQLAAQEVTGERADG